MEGNRIFINQGLTLVINQECNGFIPYFFFLASIIAFPSTLKHKIIWATLAYTVLSILNVFRIWFITKLVMNSENNFSLAHDYLGNALLVFSSMVLFITFIRTQKH
jgi:exosortase/archaeosortase family protein